jgi:hypothetical protein
MVATEFEVMLRHLPGGIERETTENLSEDNRRSCQDSNRAPPDYTTATFTVW